VPRQLLPRHSTWALLLLAALSGPRGPLGVAVVQVASSEQEHRLGRTALTHETLLFQPCSAHPTLPEGWR